MMLPVFSSATNRWEEKSFERQGEALGTVAEVGEPWPGDQQYGVYWRGHLYVHHNFIWRYYYYYSSIYVNTLTLHHHVFIIN
jgi:hypothetical protein